MKGYPLSKLIAKAELLPFERKQEPQVALEPLKPPMTNTPFRRPSCQAREEKRKFSPTAHSSAAAPPLSTQSHVSCCAAHACRGERKWRPKVYPAREVVHSFSRCLSLLMTAAIVPTVPPLSCSAPLPWSVCLSLSLSLSRSLSLSLSRLYAFKNVIVFNVHNMLPIQGEQWRHPRLSASFMWVFPMTCRFSRVPVGRLVHLI